MTGEDYRSFAYAVEEGLDGIPLGGMDVADVGAGRGFFAMYAAIVRGARRVVAVDPYLGHGSSPESGDDLPSMASQVGLDNVELRRQSFLDGGLEAGCFDLVWAHHVLHHAYETTLRVKRSAEARDRYVAAVVALARLLKPGGWLVIGEVGRHNIARITGLHLFHTRTIEWDKKQTSGEWALVASDAGLEDVQVIYHVARRLARLGRVLGTQAGNYLLGSAFYVRGRRPRE